MDIDEDLQCNKFTIERIQDEVPEGPILKNLEGVPKKENMTTK